MSRYTWLIGAALLGPTACGATIAHGEGPWRRWAVISSPEVRTSGLGDLATAELGRVREIELVERDELQKIERELELSQLVAADAAGRLKLGKRLRADGLCF